MKLLKDILLYTLDSTLPAVCGMVPVLFIFARLNDGPFPDPFVFLFLAVYCAGAPVMLVIWGRRLREKLEERVQKTAKFRKWLILVTGTLVLVTVSIQYGPTLHGAMEYALQPRPSVAERRTAHPDELVQIPALASGSMPLALSYIPSGTFVTGKWLERRRIILTHDFWLGKYEVTNGQFEAFVNDTGYVTTVEKEGKAYGWDAKGQRWGQGVDGLSWRNPQFPQPQVGEWRNHPVVYVSWIDAKAFCKWLGEKLGGVWDLPTTAQWEYACRAGTTTRYYWGNSASDACQYANVANPGVFQWLRDRDDCFNERSPFPCEDGFFATAPVGQLVPNAFGLYDMIGNVLELCRNKHSYKGPSTLFLAVDPQSHEAEDSHYRDVRGSSWLASIKYGNWDADEDTNQGRGESDLGFRVLRMD